MCTTDREGQTAGAETKGTKKFAITTDHTPAANERTASAAESRTFTGHARHDVADYFTGIDSSGRRPIFRG